MVKKIETLEKEGRLTGITDDRGKFIHITQEEYDQVEAYIRQQGRINRAQLLIQANKLVRTEPTHEAKAQIEKDK